MSTNFKKVFLINSRSIYYFPYLSKKQFVEVDSKIGFFKANARKILWFLKARFPTSNLVSSIFNHFFPYTYSFELIKSIKKSNIVVFFDSCAYLDLIKYCFKKRKKLYIYIWNPIDERSLLTWKTIIPENNIVTYSRIEALKYNLSYHVDPYFKVPIKNEVHNNYEWDFYFLGRIKGEKSIILLNFFEKLHNNGFVVRADLYDDNNDYPNVEKYPFVCLLQSFLEWEDYLARAVKSRCLVEVAYKDNIIPTFRVQDSIFYSRKLITNNNYFRDEFFYNNKNILIVDFDNPNYFQIRNFIYSNDAYWDDNIKQRYSIDNFIEWFK